MKEIIYKDIAEYINKAEQTVRGYKVNNPNLLDILKLGAFCKKNNITIEKIKKCAQLQELAKNQNL